MGFIIRSAFWLSLVLLLIPFGNGSNGEPSVGAVETFLAARGLVADRAGLCERRPDVCETGRAAMQVIGVRAQEAVRIVSNALVDDEDETTAEPLVTGSVPQQPGSGVSSE